jgi:DNA-binding transcriptional MerR regulator
VEDDRLSIEELADAAGLTRRGIRFYVQQQLIPAPHGVGRGKHYDGTHLERLRRVRDLQAAGHSLDEIRHILSGKTVASAATAKRGPAGRAPTPAPLRAELWRRLRIAEGVELSFDAAKYNPTVEDLIELRDAITSAFKDRDTDADDR